MITIKRAPEGEFPRGTWRAVLRDGERAAAFACPKCDFRGGLGFGTNHVIANNGIVSPSVVCDGAGCDFHEHVQLEGWQP